MEVERQSLAEAVTAAERKYMEEKRRADEYQQQVKIAKAGMESAKQELVDYKQKATRILQVQPFSINPGKLIQILIGKDVCAKHACVYTLLVIMVQLSLHACRWSIADYQVMRTIGEVLWPLNLACNQVALHRYSQGWPKSSVSYQACDCCSSLINEHSFFFHPSLKKS